MRYRTRLLATVAVLALLTMACSARTGDDFQQLSGDVGEPTTTAAAAETTTTIATANESLRPRGPLGFQGTADRKVIYNATLDLVTKDTEAAFAAITKSVEGAGGYVTAASQAPFRDDVDEPLVTMQVRVPGDSLTGTLAEIEAVVDHVRTKTIDSQDVTEEFADLDAQLTNLKALETELRDLLKEVQDDAGADPTKLLQVFDSIRQNRGEIELLEGRRQLLSNLVALATISITITPSVEIVPIVAEDGWKPAEVAKDALRRTVAFVQHAADWLITFALHVLPILILLGLPVAGGWLVLRRWRRGKSSPVPAE